MWDCPHCWFMHLILSNLGDRLRRNEDSAACSSASKSLNVFYPPPTSRFTLCVVGGGRVHKQVCGVRGLTSLQKAWAMYSIPLLTAALMFATIGLLHVTDKLRCRRRPRMPSIRSQLSASEQCTTVVEGSSDSGCDVYRIRAATATATGTGTGTRPQATTATATMEGVQPVSRPLRLLRR